MRHDRLRFARQMRWKFAPRLGYARSMLDSGLLIQHTRAIRNSCLEFLDPQLQLRDLVRVPFAAFPELHLAQFEDVQFERFNLSRIRENLRVFNGELPALREQLFALNEQRRMLFTQQRFEFRNTQSVELGKLNARSIHTLIVSMLRRMSTINYYLRCNSASTFCFVLRHHSSMSGSAVRTGCRQSIPSSSIDSCAGVSDTDPFCACGHIKRPRSNRLAIKHSPVPSHHISSVSYTHLRAHETVLDLVCRL